MMGDSSSRLYLPSAIDIYADFFCRAVSVEDVLYLAVTGNADINTPEYYLWYGHSSDDAACCTAMDVHVPLKCGLRVYCLSCCLFTSFGVCAAFHTAARVDAAPFSTVDVGVMLPHLLRLMHVLSFILLLG